MLRVANTKVVGIFDDRYQATLALDELRQAGFREEHLSFAIRGDEAVHGGMVTDALLTRDGNGAFRGVFAGALIGIGIAALASVLVKSHPTADMGIVANLIGFAFAGMVVGAIFGAMVGLAVSEHEARIYQREFEAGRAIVAVSGGDLLDARLILRRHGARSRTARSETVTAPVGPA